MRFDDRLSTVLGLSAEAPRDRAVQWRQLVELVARGGGSSDPALLTRALARIAELGPEVPPAVRTAAARAIAGPHVPTKLITLFAADLPEVAAPLLGSLELDEQRWSEVRSAASPAVRELIDTLHPPSAPSPPALSPAPAPATVPPSTATPPLFHWECGPAGELDWVEGVPRTAVIGHSLRAELPRSFEAMQPFADEPVTLAAEGALAGEWRWSGQPRFLPGSGRFAGYSGFAVRAPDEAGERASQPPSSVAFPLDHDSLRELIHELRTPLTAIIGFGEIIEGQFLGPAHRAYRDRAGEIVRQARLLLAAAEDLDLAAQLRSGRLPAGEGTAVAPLAEALADRVTVILRDPEVRCGLEAGLAQRLVSRFVDSIVATAPQQRLGLVVSRVDGQACLALDRPAATLALSEARLLQPDAPGGLGFALRLIRGLAQTVGGSLEIDAERFILCLPAV